MTVPVVLQEIWSQMIQNVGGDATSQSLLGDLMLDFSVAVADAVAVPDTDATALQGVDISPTAPTNGQILTFNGTVWIPGSSGSANAVELQSVPIAVTTPTSGQALVFNGTAWAPGTAGGGGSVTGGSSFPSSFSAVNPIAPNTLTTLASLSIGAGAGLVMAQAQFAVTEGDIDILIIPSGGTISQAICSTTLSASINETVCQGQIGGYIDPGSTTSYVLACITTYSGFNCNATSEQGCANATGIYTIGG